ncbi:MAG: OmpA family protein [Chitinispirillaceae bacterium]|nr:OmpA family protein [Chitinispirillaceae bacterium]
MKQNVLWLFLLYLSLSRPTLTAANDLNTGGQKGVIRALSAYTLGTTGYNIGGAFRYATGPSYVSGPGGTSSVIDATSRLAIDPGTSQLLSGNVYAAFGLFRFVDLSASLPVYGDITGWGAVGNGLGDLEAAVKLAYPYQLPNALISHAYYLNVIFPTGDTATGFFPRHSYYIKNDANNSGMDAYSAGAVFFNPMLAWTMDFSRLKRPVPACFHANFGGVVAKEKSGSAVLAALALEFSPFAFLTLFAELSGESRVKFYTESFSYTSFDNDPFRSTAGVRFNLPGGWYGQVAGDIAFADSNPKYLSNWNRNGYRYSTRAQPKWAGQVNFGWTGQAVKSDRDRDGIPDKIDQCPDEPEDNDGYQDDDGCPDPDNDGDGIPDAVDRCPDAAAPCSGCPVIDKDGDGIPDDRDKCTAAPEDKDGFQDDDGCPDPDNDGDGILDVDDKCPLIAEDLDGFEDNDGCPESDNDNDGILDVADKCPDVPGVFENSGCPAVKKTGQIARGSLVLTGVRFETGRAVLSPSSYAALDRVAESLREWQEVTLEVRGHTDSRGDALINQRLSQARAEAVRLYLIQKGVTPERLTTVGYGEEHPIESNNTASGRQKNRRVELHRTD